MGRRKTRRTKAKEPTSLFGGKRRRTRRVRRRRRRR